MVLHKAVEAALLCTAHVHEEGQWIYLPVPLLTGTGTWMAASYMLWPRAVLQQLARPLPQLCRSASIA
jgi:hypothetical protein